MALVGIAYPGRTIGAVLPRTHQPP